MIVTKPESELRLVTQPDHAKVAGEILSLWRSAELECYTRREELLFAVREHDNGWQETDSAPRVNRSIGHPHDVFDLPDLARQELWQRGVDRYRNDRPYVAAVITLHAIQLHEARRPEPGWADWLDPLEERLETLVESNDFDRVQIDSDYRWLALADALALRACGALSDRLEWNGLISETLGDDLWIDPFPLAGATTFEFACRHIPDRDYASDSDLTLELATARWETTSFRLLPRPERKVRSG